MDNPNKSLHKTIPDAIDCTEATDGNKHNIFFVGISFYKLESGTKTEHYYYQYHKTDGLWMGYDADTLDSTICAHDKLCGFCKGKSLND